MRKLFIAILAILVVVSTAYAKVETYEGIEEYYVLGAVEDINVARERARERALRDAREKAGVYIHTFSQMSNMKMIKDEVVCIASGVLRVIDTVYEIVPLTDVEGIMIRAKVKANIDTGDLEKFLQKDAEELSKFISNEKAIRLQEEQQDKKINTLKQEYKKASTSEEKELIAQQILEEDKVFLSNQKLREGNQYRDEENHKKAAELFTEAINLNPENFLAWHNRGWAYIEQKKYKEAMADFDKSAELNPKSELPYFGRGWVYAEQRKFSEAVREYDKVINLNPKYAIAWNNRGAAKSWLNQTREAIVDYNKAVELKPNYAKAYENRGLAFRELGDWKKASADFDRAEHIKWSNEHADKIIDEALALRKNGKSKEALKLLNDAAELYPDNQFVFVNRGNIYNDDLRDYETAIADYNKTIEINAKFSWPYLNRAIAYGRIKRWEDAVVDCGQAIELDQNYANAYNQRAWAYCQIGNFEAALVDVNKALELKPNEANYFDTRASIYAGLKRYKDALADMNKAIKLAPEGWLYYNRGEIYRLAGEESKAQADYEKARSLGYNC